MRHFIFLFFLINFSLLSLEARERYQREYHPQYGKYDNQYRSQYDNRYRYNQPYYNQGGYGGGYSVYPYPPQGSQPGMSDDTNALYQSYLRSHGQGY